jgi:hypothetical protein
MCMLGARLWSARLRSRGEGMEENQRKNPMRSKLPMHHSLRCGARTRSGSRCRSPADAERPLPNAWRDVPRRSEG